MWIVIDFETVSSTDLKKAGAWHYAECPTTDVLCMAWETEAGRHGVWYPGDPAPAFLDDPDAVLIAHNAGFEKAIWRNIMSPVYGWPPVPNRRWHDTLAVCAMKTIPLDLEHALRVLRLAASKDMEGSKLTIGLSKPDKKTGMLPPITPEVRERVGLYCERDIVGQTALHRRLGWLPPGERKVWLLNQRINERGFALDMPLVHNMQKIVDEASAPLAEEFASLTGGLRMTQIQKVRGWASENGLVLPNLKAETLDELFGEDEDAGETLAGEDGEFSGVVIPENVGRALSIRRLIGSSSVKKLSSMDLCVGDDGRAHGTMQYHGAGTGREAGRLLQPTNFPRGSDDKKWKALTPEDRVAAFMTGDPELVKLMTGLEPVEAVVSSLRHTVCASKGRVLVARDFSGIEARTVLAIAGQHDKCRLLASGVDVYCQLAEQIFGVPVTKENVEMRQIGKNSILGCGFGMGAWKFRLRYCKTRSEEFAKTVIDTYRQVWAPEVPKLWKGLEWAALRTVHDRTPHEAYGVRYELTDDGFMTARLPSGRKLWYFNPQPCRRAMPWDPSDIRLAWTYQAKKLGKWLTIDAYGGLETENVVQGLARDLLVIAMFKCEAEGLPIVLSVYDEIVCEPEESRNDAGTTLTQIMEDIPDWARALQIPVAVEGWEGERYRK